MSEIDSSGSTGHATGPHLHFTATADMSDVVGAAQSAYDRWVLSGPVATTDAAALSSMLFQARELISMFRDVVESRSGKTDEWSRRVVKDIDEYRAERGWSPHGFGGEA